MSDFDKRFEFKEWEEYNLHQDSSLDKYALDMEAEEQSHVLQKWLDLLVQAQAELSKAKELVLDVEAKLFIDAKTNGIAGLEKPTEGTVKAWVRIQPEYKKALRRRRKAENNVSYLQNARSVLEHRKSMIKIESDLWITGYFARPNISGKVKEAIEDEAKAEHAQELSKSLQRRHLREKGE